MKKLIITIIASQIFIIGLLHGEAYARLPNGDSQKQMYSNRTERLFREAAKQYWEAHDWNSTYYCSPYETEIIYGEFDPDYIARVVVIGAGNRLLKGESYYCKTFFNTIYKEPRRSACVTFIHEFGHLMERVHNWNNESPMYNHYAYYQGDKRSRLFTRWKKNAVGKTLCNAADIHG